VELKSIIRCPEPPDRPFLYSRPRRSWRMSHEQGATRPSRRGGCSESDRDELSRTVCRDWIVGCVV